MFKGKADKKKHTKISRQDQEGKLQKERKSYKMTNR